MRYPARLIRNLTILALVITMLNKVFLCYYRVNYNQNSSTLIITDEHRYACLLKQQLPITVYLLPTKENKLLSSVSVFSKDTKVCHFRFKFAANKLKSPFSFSSVLLAAVP